MASGPAGPGNSNVSQNRLSSDASSILACQDCGRLYETQRGLSQHVTERYLSKFAHFTPSHLHLAPLLGVTQFKFQKDFCASKIPGLSCGFVFMFLCLAILPSVL